MKLLPILCLLLASAQGASSHRFRIKGDPIDASFAPASVGNSVAWNNTSSILADIQNPTDDAVAMCDQGASDQCEELTVLFDIDADAFANNVPILRADISFSGRITPTEGLWITSSTESVVTLEKTTGLHFVSDIWMTLSPLTGTYQPSNVGGAGLSITFAPNVTTEPTTTWELDYLVARMEVDVSRSMENIYNRTGAPLDEIVVGTGLVQQLWLTGAGMGEGITPGTSLSSSTHIDDLIPQSLNIIVNGNFSASVDSVVRLGSFEESQISSQGLKFALPADLGCGADDTLRFRLVTQVGILDDTLTFPCTTAAPVVVDGATDNSTDGQDPEGFSPAILTVIIGSVVALVAMGALFIISGRKEAIDKDPEVEVESDAASSRGRRTDDTISLASMPSIQSTTSSVISRQQMPLI